MKGKASLGTILPVLFGFFVMGFCDVVGIATSYVKQDFGLSETVAGFIPSMVFVWFLLLSIPAAMWTNKVGRKNMVQISNVITAVGMIVPFVWYNFVTCMIGFVLLGVGNAILQVSLNPLLTNVVDGKRLTSMLTAGQVIKAVSSLCGPFIAAFALSVLGEWRYLFPIFAAITCASAIWLMLSDVPKENSELGSSSFAAAFSLMKDKTVLMLFFGIFFIVGVDVGTNTVAPKLLMERGGLSVDQAGFGSSLYFFCRTAGAFLGSFALAKINEVKYFRYNIIVAVAAICLLLFAKSTAFVLVMIGFVGFFCASVFSIIYSLAMKQCPDKTNEVSGLMITGLVGGAVVPPLMGVMTDAVGSQTGSLVVILVCAVYLAVCAFTVKAAKR